MGLITSKQAGIYLTLAAGRNDEAHFDFARAICGEGAGQAPENVNLNHEQLDEAKELLEQHHR